LVRLPDPGQEEAVVEVVEDLGETDPHLLQGARAVVLQGEEVVVDKVKAKVAGLEEWS
jgi:hypothetical protein